MLERLSSAILGERMPLPPHIPEGSLPPGVVLRRGSLIPRLGGFFGRMKGPAAAVTLGRTIIVHPNVRLSRELLAHELTHARQWSEDPLFLVRYSLATLRYGYRENPYEVEARHRELAAHTASGEEIV